jgi:hypothetical protein
MLKQLLLYCTVDRIFVTNNQATSHQEAKAVVQNRQLVFHKQDAMVKVKLFLAQNQFGWALLMTAVQPPLWKWPETSSSMVATSG